MGLKKYEIITVGGDKRVRALRSWQVQDRYVNIGDVGGIVYDEKTLSQDGACWLFKGNFNFPGARIGGDSIVDIGEATPPVAGSSNVDILGTSTFVGSPTRFSSDQTAADAVTLTAADFEQGSFTYSAGANWETWKVSSANQLRTKNPIFAGGVATTLKLDVPGYTVQAFVLDRDGIGINATAGTNTGAGVTLTIPAGQYFILRLTKNPVAPIVPADATAAQIKFTGTYETKLVMVDSRLEVNPPTSTGIVTIISGGTHDVISGVKYPDSVIRDSKVVINGHATASRNVRLMVEFINVNATIDATATNAQGVGTYRNVNNLAFSGTFIRTLSALIPGMIRAYDCDNMVVTAANFPSFAGILSANVPVKFYGCNLNTARIYHHAQIANTYRDINFDLATADLGKLSVNGYVMVSSEVSGMYRLYSTTGSLFGALVENYESVQRLSLSNIADSYATTIYADAYLNGIFDLKGTNVFGNTMKHDANNTQDVMAVQGSFNNIGLGTTITGIVNNATQVCIPTPFRINGAKGITISNLPAGFEAVLFTTNANSVISGAQTTTAANTDLEAARLFNCNAYIRFRKVDITAITPEEVAGVTVTTYNGCKIVNTKATAATIAGNVRVEDNATLIDTSVTGTGYFGGNSTIQAPSALVGQLPIEGAAYMSDNAVFAPSAANASANVAFLDMRDNAVFAGSLNNSAASYDITMMGAARCLGTVNNSRSKIIMRGNSFVAEAGTVAPECRGLLTMKDDARVESGGLVAKGHITLCGKYKQTAAKTWTGKRTITDVNAPAYDDNVKTKYDF